MTPLDHDASVCVSLLFQVLTRTDGRTAGLHVGEQPFLLGSSVRVPLAKSAISRPALEAIIRRLLPEGPRRTLATLGWVEYQRPAGFDVAGQQFTIVAVHRADDLWLEIHRERVAAAAAVADDDDLADVVGPLFQPRQQVKKDDLSLPSEEELWPSAHQRRAG